MDYLDLGLALGFSSYENPSGAIYEQCKDESRNSNADGDVSFRATNLSWTNDDAMDEGEEPVEVIGDMSFSVNDCESGCHECREAWMSDDADNVYASCQDARPMRYGQLCKSNANTKMCSPGDDYCLKSYPYGDPARFKSRDAGCRSLPDAYLENLEYGKKKCKSRVGLCPECDFGQKCRWSYRADDADIWKGATAMCRCFESF